jgi:hypothetical protein
LAGSWVVVQNAAEVDLALTLDGAQSGSLSYLATSAAAYFALKEHGLACRGTHEFASRESTDQVAFDNFEKLRSLTLGLDEALHEGVPDMAEGFRPFEAFEYDFKKIIDAASFALMELLGFARAESPEEVLYWDDSWGQNTNSSGEPGSIRVAVGPGNQTLTSELLGEQGWWAGHGIVTRRVPGQSQAPASAAVKGWRPKLRELLNPNRIEGLRVIGWGASPSLLFRNDRPRLLVVGKSDNSVSFVKHSISTYKAQVDWWTNDLHSPVQMPSLVGIRLNGASDRAAGVLAKLGDVFNRLQEDVSWSHDLDWIPIDNIIKRRFPYLRKRVPRVWTAYINSIEYFRTRKPDAVIAGTADTDVTQAVRQAAAVSGVPMASFQHGGSHGYMHSEWLKLSDLRADLYVGYGVDGCSYLERFARSRGLRTRAVSIGWSRGTPDVRNLTESAGTQKRPTQQRPGLQDKDRQKIMYVPTSLGGERRYGPYCGYHDTEYCLRQVEVIEALRQVPDSIVMIKLHPKEKTVNPLVRWVRQLNDANVRILVGGRLPKALAQADLVVLDCPTTTLLEVMAMASRMVYLHLGLLKWTPEGESLMRKTTPWVDATPGWESRLREAVVQTLGRPALKSNDNRFLDAYASLDFRPELVWNKLQDIQRARTQASN